MNKTAVPEIKLQMAEKAIDLLQKIGASYKVLLGDRAWGELELAKTKHAPRVIRNRGAREYIRPFMAELRHVGDVVSVPATLSFPARALQSSIAAYGNDTWGAGVIKTHTTHDTTAVETMLLEALPETPKW